ncbi:MAG: hypothetical protein A2W25_15095 [candidate division Zixibacteria bacterium RBG_16_53_22]|nr:MAG: hypothetical protein A2W25_15095 [candidate division Zixibacteria bacterium RBG_16_53_22]
MINHGEEQGIDFERLYKAVKSKSVIMIDNGFCHYHHRRDGQLTIHVLLSAQPGVGKKMLAMLLKIQCTFIVAKCPADLKSNKWYAKRGFVLSGTQESKTGRVINIWRFNKCQTLT